MQNFVRGNRQRRILLVFFLDIYIYFTSLDAPDAVNKRVYFPVLKVLLRCNTWKRVGFLREIYISRFRAKSRGWSKYLKSIYICLSEFKGFLKFGFDKYRFYFFFFFFWRHENSTGFNGKFDVRIQICKSIPAIRVLY